MFKPYTLKSNDNIKCSPVSLTEHFLIRHEEMTSSYGGGGVFVGEDGASVLTVGGVDTT